ncbi:MAG: hypothetical protein KGL18_02720 [Burkholderiales bacterium]|nr:hypothetical protein [Burkholderiales bacterium]MDE1926875.1 hypothetical protein [Burkholderiales bacterium]MDE2159139.1 hypothetical protein [Burkholderiales bacterium]MDE2501879.1 hypothetical protein [Burkholderiales bacterium]
MIASRLRRAAGAAALLLAGASAPAAAQVMADPWQPWSSADSAHFRVHYRSAQRAQAEAVAAAAERAWPSVTGRLQWRPAGRTDIVVHTESDLANGDATALPYNEIGVYLAPPDDGELLDDSAWLDLLLRHEYSHVVQFDEVRGAPRWLQAVFGRWPWFVPNLLQPGWAIEGLAVSGEGDPAAGRGRLRGPLYEAWLRADRRHGFIGLAELNADGRALPVTKQYLYGAYFYDFLARRYGADKIPAWVANYSGNLLPRLYSNPLPLTGKTMDALWAEFLADLAQQVDARAGAPQPEALGARLLGPVFDIPSVVALPGGALLAVVDDGWQARRIVRIAADGSRRDGPRVDPAARLTVNATGAVLVTQPDLCRITDLAYDVYRLEGDRLVQLSHCAHLRRAITLGSEVLALQLDAGATRLVRLEAGGAVTPLYQPPPGTDLIDLAAAGAGRRVALISHHDADWRLIEIDLDHPGAAPRTLVQRAAPLLSLRRGRDGLEFIAAVDNRLEVWRLAGASIERLTRSDTAVVAQGGSGSDGSLATVVVAAGGYELHRLAAPRPLQTLPADAGAPAAVAAAPATVAVLGPARPYAAWRSVYPRAWMPAVTLDRGLRAWGATTYGSDALAWHQYAATAQWETQTRQWLGSAEYLFWQTAGLAVSRTLSTLEVAGDRPVVYDQRTQAQGIVVLPLDRLERRIHLGAGAALDRTLRTDRTAGTVTRLQDQRLLALLAQVDSSIGNWYSEGPNRGLTASLQYETYRPFAGADPARYDGAVTRADLRGYLPLGRSVLALRATEVRASGRTAPFQLGGANDPLLQLGPLLDSRTLALRGYDGHDAALRGANAAVASVEWRMRLSDIDRHAMVPALGIARLSATAFVDVGGAWNQGHGPAGWHRGVGFELLGEIKIAYALPLLLRLGLAQGLDAPRGIHGYLTLGRSF